MTSTSIDLDTLRALGMGAAVLSAGGGSFPYLEHLCTARFLGERTVELRSVDKLPRDARVALVAMVGAPLVMTERFLDADHFVKPVHELEAIEGQPFDAIMGYEIGSMNGVIPVLIAAHTGLPLIDADTVGRSFPQVHMSSFALAGVPMTPMVLCDVRNNSILLRETVDGRWTEDLLRVVTTAFGSVAACATSAPGATVIDHAIPGTYSRAIRIGEAILGAQKQRADVVAALLHAESGIELGRGRIVDIARETTDGFVRGTAKINDATGEMVRVDFQNEYAVVMRGGEIISTVPDLICLFDAQRGEPIGTESLRYAQQVAVVSLPPAAAHITPHALAVLGPRGFGYDFNHVSPHLTGYSL